MDAHLTLVLVLSASGSRTRNGRIEHESHFMKCEHDRKDTYEHEIHVRKRLALTVVLVVNLICDDQLTYKKGAKR